MKSYVTTVPHCEPPVASRVPAPAAPSAAPRCAGRPDLRSGRRMPHSTPTPRHHAATHADAVDRPAAPGVPRTQDCRHFTELALRSILEVLDRRRHVSALSGFLAATPMDLVTALARAGAPGRRLGAAALRRVHVSNTGPDSAEVFGTYVRGPRTFAVACRVERAVPRSRSRTGPTSGSTTTTHLRRAGTPASGWVVTSLQIG